LNLMAIGKIQHQLLSGQTEFDRILIGAFAIIKGTRELGWGGIHTLSEGWKPNRLESNVDVHIKTIGGSFAQGTALLRFLDDL